MANDVAITVRAENLTGGAFSAVNRQLGNLQGQAGAAGGAVGQLSGRMGGLSGAAIGVGAAIGLSALPALGGFVPMLVGAGAAAGTLALAFRGVGGALDAAGEDQEKYRELLSKMNPAQKAFTEELVDVRKEFKGFSGQIQKIALPKFTEALKEARPAINTVKSGMKDMASTLGDVSVEFGKLLGSDRFRQALKKNMSMGREFITSFTRGLGGFTQGLLEFGAASKPTFDTLNRGLSGLLGNDLPGMFRGLERGVKGSAAMFDGLFDALSAVLPALGRFSGQFADTFGPVIGAMLRRIGELAAALMDALRPAMEELAPLFGSAADAMNSTNGIVGKLAKGLGEVLAVAVKFAIIPMKNLFDLMAIAAPFVKSLGRAIVDTLAPAFGSMNGKLGWTEKLRDFVSSHKLELQQMFTAGADALMGFAIAVVENLPQVFSLFRQMSIVALTAFGVMIAAAAESFDWIPGIGKKIRKAADDFGTFKDSAIENLNAAQGKLERFSEAVTPRLERNRLKMNIRNWKMQIDTAKKKLKSVPPSKRAELRAKISQLQQQVRRAKSAIGSVRGKKVWITSVFTSIYRSVRQNRTFNNFDGSFAQGGVTSGRRAMGGIIGTAASGGPRGNMTWVGEQGPELVSLPVGSTVRTAGDSQRMMRDTMRDAGGRGGGRTVIEVRSGGSRLDDLLVEILRKSIRTRGGDVQLVLGDGGRG